jgi:hypothetical protein
VKAAQELLARGTSMVEAAVALSCDFGLSRRQAYHYLEEAQAVAQPQADRQRVGDDYAQDPEQHGTGVARLSASRGLTLSEIVRRATSAFLSAARGHG